MFSGIIEAHEKIVKVEPLDQALRVWIVKPSHFDDLKIGDSIATNGVCLTLETEPIINNTPTMQFTLGAETLKVLNQINPNEWLNKIVNLERSLRFGDRIHGHLVSGHVEAMGQVIESSKQGENWFLNISIPQNIQKFCWSKGSLTVNGVSLTINDITQLSSLSENLTNTNFHISAEFCLIPETQKRTNLPLLKLGDSVCLEADYMVKTIFQGVKNGELKNV